MSVLISDETLRACQMEAAEFKQEIALLLFQSGRLTIGHASQLAEMPPNAFREMLTFLLVANHQESAECKIQESSGFLTNLLTKDSQAKPARTASRAV